MYWKYHIECGDHVSFRYDGELVGGTVRGWLEPDNFENKTFDDVEVSDFELYVTSGDEDVTINLEDVEDRITEDDRETDLPLLSERFRLTGGIGQV